REDAHRSGAGHERALGLPEGHPPLRGDRVAPTLLADRERLEEDGDSGDLLGDGEEVLGPLGIALGAVAMEPADPALGVPPPEAHGLLAPRAVRAAVGTSHARDDRRPSRERADPSRDAPEGFVAEHEDLRAGRRLAVFAALDLGIGPAQTDADHVDERFAVARRR